MTGIELAEIRTAIVQAYNAATFDRLLSDRFDFKRANHVGDAGFHRIVEQVLELFVHEGLDAYLIAELAADRPGKREIQALYHRYAHGLVSEAWRARVDAAACERLARYGLIAVPALQRAGAACAASDPGDPGATAFGGFQKQIRAELPDLDVLPWSALLLRQTCRVCRIELGGTPRGTGFLVGPDAVLTSYHVVRDAIAARASGAAIRFLFDYWRTAGGAPAAGTRVAARGAWPDWHVDSSPPLSSPEEHAGSPEPRGDQLDHAVIALERPLGELPVGPGGPNRGWIEVPATPPTLAVGMPVAILHHPRTAPIKLTLDTRALQRVNAGRTRLRYATNTEHGSSGSPCFDVELGVIAVHHFSDPDHAAPAYNQGTPIEAIHRRLAAVGKLGALGGASP